MVKMKKIEGAEERLMKKVKKASKEINLPIKNRVDDIFNERMYFFPQDFKTINYPRDIKAVFNPGVDFDGKAVEIFPRFAFDYHVYTGSIGRCEKINIENLFSGDFKKPILTEIILYPGIEKTGREDFNGYEDARIFSQNGTSFVLCTGNVGKGHHDDEFSRKVGGVLVLAKFEKRKLIEKGYFKIGGKDGNFLIESQKDAAFITIKGNKANLLTRLGFGNDFTPTACWSGEADLADFKELIIPEDNLEVILLPPPWTTKVGWSSNTVQIGSDEYLVGLHEVLKSDLSYNSRLAVINGQGELQAITPDYVLAPDRKRAIECLGDRPLVIFGDGLLIDKEGDRIVCIYGVSDWCIGVFGVDFQNAMDKLKWLKK